MSEDEKVWTPESIRRWPLRCRGRKKGCGFDLRGTIAELLNTGMLKEDGVSVDYECPRCGAPHHTSRTSAAAG
jgi:hypothetical protein